MPKLTLSATTDDVAMAKQIASARGTSVSALFSQFIRSVARPKGLTKAAPKTRRATGLIRLPKGKTDRELVEQAMAARFMR